MNDRDRLFGEVRGLVGRGDREAYQALTRLVDETPDDEWVRDVLSPYLVGALRMNSWDRWAVELDAGRVQEWGTPSEDATTSASTSIAVKTVSYTHLRAHET